MKIFGARDLVSGVRKYTIVLEDAGHLYSIYHYHDVFTLAVSHDGQTTKPLVQHADWEAFLKQVPERLKESGKWARS